LEVPVGHPQFGRAQRCACQEKAIHDGLQAISGVTPSEQLITLDDIDCGAGPGTTAMVNAARKFLTDPRGILTLYGTSGNAKTTVLQAVVNAMVDRGVPSVYVTIFDVMGWLKEAFNQDRSVRNESAWERIKRLESIPFLAMDEFDKVSRTDWVIDQLTDLVDHRHRYGLDGIMGTVIAMNKPIENMPDWIASRLKDGRNVAILNNDTDMRPMMRR
jgi:DNA replication protein DnaC